MDYTTRRGTPTSPDAIVLRFVGYDRETVIRKSHRRNGYRGKKTYGYSTPITLDGRVVDILFCTSWDGIVEAVWRGDNRRTIEAAMNAADGGA